MPSHTPKERAKRGNTHKNRGKGLKVTVEVRPVKRKPKKSK